MHLTIMALLIALWGILLVGATPSRAQEGDPVEPQLITLARVADIYAGSNHSYPSSLVSYDGKLYFGANGNDGAGAELWSYDPTSGAHRVADILSGPSGSGPQDLTVYDGSLYFSGYAGDYPTELWKYDPAGGAMLVTNNGSALSWPQGLASYDGKLYFGADGGDGAGVELWSYDPTSGAQRVADILSGSSPSQPGDLAVYDGSLYFSASGGATGQELWKYDTAGGVMLVEDINPGNSSSRPRGLAVYQDALYFGANGGDGTGLELWKYDPDNGAQQVADIYAGSGSSSPTDLAVYHNALYFAADGNDGAGPELWKYDPTNGPVRAADIYNGSSSSVVAHLAVYNDALYFRANGGDGAGNELWLFSNSTTAAFRSSPARDGWLLESGENTGVGGSLNSTGAVLRVGDNAQDKQYRSVLSFDTSTLPDNAVITKVTLEVYREGVTGANPFSTHGALYVDVRKGAFSGDPALQPDDFQATASYSKVGSIPSSATSGWYRKTWTTGILRYINKAGVTQLRLRFNLDDNDDLGADYLMLSGGDAAGISARPRLVVRYYSP